VIVDRDPKAEYEKRLQERRKAVALLERRDRNISVLRLGTAALFMAVAFLTVWEGAASAWWLAVPTVVFLSLVVVHERVARAKRRALESVDFYENGLARIEDRWIGRGPSTEISRSEAHLYAADLDIFGKASLFELLCTARMRTGQEKLAAWLSEPADPEEILSRQKAVDELRYCVDLREEIAILATDIQSSIHPGILTRWSAAPRILENQVAVRVLLALETVGAIVALVLNFAVWPLVFAIEGAIGLIYRHRVRQAIEAADRPERELLLLSQLLARIEKERFESDKLVKLRRSLDTNGLPASRQIARFAFLIDMLNWRRNELFAPFSLILFWATQLSFAIEEWRARVGPVFGAWLEAVGEFEALCALSGYAYEHPDDPFPEIIEKGSILHGDLLRHPLMPYKQCVPNSVRIGDMPQLLVVSGSNMSGKSTLLRTVGINAVLAFAGAPVRAKSLRISPFAIGATLRIQDSLQAGTSRFYAEIQRIHQIMELARPDRPVLFLLDEVLHGTNSHDRAVGAEAIVRGLIARAAIGLVTTHDLALAAVADALAPRASNVHFEDEVVGGKIAFDYQMRPGVVRKSNALELMRAVGLEI